MRTCEGEAWRSCILAGSLPTPPTSLRWVLGLPVAVPGVGRHTSVAGTMSGILREEGVVVPSCPGNQLPPCFLCSRPFEVVYQQRPRDQLSPQLFFSTVPPHALFPSCSRCSRTLRSLLLTTLSFHEPQRYFTLARHLVFVLNRFWVLNHSKTEHKVQNPHIPLSPNTTSPTINIPHKRSVSKSMNLHQHVIPTQSPGYIRVHSCVHTQFGFWQIYDDMYTPLGFTIIKILFIPPIHSSPHNSSLFTVSSFAFFTMSYSM